MSLKHNARQPILAAMFLALALVLPFLTGQIPQIGNKLCPMHIPVLLCGFFCGPWYGLAVGLIAPLMRSLLFGAPPLIPKGISMSLELAAYGLVSGCLYRALPKTKPYIYVSLIGAMLVGRLIWGGARLVFYGLGLSDPFGWSAFLAGALLDAIPGIIIQLLLVPILVMALKKEQRRSPY